MERGEKTGEEMDRGNPKTTYPRRSQRIKDARNVKFAETEKEEKPLVKGDEIITGCLHKHVRFTTVGI